MSEIPLTLSHLSLLWGYCYGDERLKKECRTNHKKCQYMGFNVEGKINQAKKKSGSKGKHYEKIPSFFATALPKRFFMPTR